VCVYEFGFTPHGLLRTVLPRAHRAGVAFVRSFQTSVLEQCQKPLPSLVQKGCSALSGTKKTSAFSQTPMWLSDPSQTPMWLSDPESLCLQSDANVDFRPRWRSSMVHMKALSVLFNFPYPKIWISI
jgi:hypothetical protein